MDKITVFIAVIVSVTYADLKSGKAPTLSLSDGYVIPVLGLGTSVRDGDPDEIRLAVELAIEAGYRHIDTATRYGTEELVGRGVAAKVQDGTIQRQDMFITTKLWNNKHRREQVIPALRQSLEKLAMDYVDLYLVHTPISLDENGGYSHTDFVETWKGMEEAQRLGLARSIGVSNFNETQLLKLLAACTIKPVVNQIELDRDLVPIPKAVTPSHIRQNIDVFDFKLTPEEIANIDDFNLNYRIVNPKEWQGSPFYPFVN